jgi:putative glycerol-1-phosphate prenyltransferase
MNSSLLNHIRKQKELEQKMLAILLDPDKISLDKVSTVCEKITALQADFIFVGGSYVAKGETQKLIAVLKKHSNIPVIIFPGDHSQITPLADGLLFLSLLSGRNPEYLIEQQIKAVPLLQNTDLEIIPTGYILINGGTKSAVERASNTEPIASSNMELAKATAIAGMYKGKELIYLEAGSGAKNPVPSTLINAISNAIDIPLIVGGGIRSKSQLQAAYSSGADLVVIGTAFEDNYAKTELLL